MAFPKGSTYVINLLSNQQTLSISGPYIPSNFELPVLGFEFQERTGSLMSTMTVEVAIPTGYPYAALNDALRGDTTAVYTISLPAQPGNRKMVITDIRRTVSSGDNTVPVMLVTFADSISKKLPRRPNKPMKFIGGVSGKDAKVAAHELRLNTGSKISVLQEEFFAVEDIIRIICNHLDLGFIYTGPHYALREFEINDTFYAALLKLTQKYGLEISLSENDVVYIENFTNVHSVRTNAFLLYSAQMISEDRSDVAKPDKIILYGGEVLFDPTKYKGHRLNLSSAKCEITLAKITFGDFLSHLPYAFGKKPIRGNYTSDSTPKTDSIPVDIVGYQDISQNYPYVTDRNTVKAYENIKDDKDFADIFGVQPPEVWEPATGKDHLQLSAEAITFKKETWPMDFFGDYGPRVHLVQYKVLKNASAGRNAARLGVQARTAGSTEVDTLLDSVVVMNYKEEYINYGASMSVGYEQPRFVSAVPEEAKYLSDEDFSDFEKLLDESSRAIWEHGSDSPKTISYPAIKQHMGFLRQPYKLTLECTRLPCRVVATADGEGKTEITKTSSTGITESVEQPGVDITGNLEAGATDAVLTLVIKTTGTAGTPGTYTFNMNVTSGSLVDVPAGSAIPCSETATVLAYGISARFTQTYGLPVGATLVYTLSTPERTEDKTYKLMPSKVELHYINFATADDGLYRPGDVMWEHTITCGPVLVNQDQDVTPLEGMSTEEADLINGAVVPSGFGVFQTDEAKYGPQGWKSLLKDARCIIGAKKVTNIPVFGQNAYMKVVETQFIKDGAVRNKSETSTVSGAISNQPLKLRKIGLEVERQLQTSTNIPGDRFDFEVYTHPPLEINDPAIVRYEDAEDILRTMATHFDVMPVTRTIVIPAALPIRVGDYIGFSEIDRPAPSGTLRGNQSFFPSGEPESSSNGVTSGTIIPQASYGSDALFGVVTHMALSGTPDTRTMTLTVESTNKTATGG